MFLRSDSPALSPVQAPETVRAPLFQDLMTRLDDGRRHVVLDLGGASTAMLELLSRARCRAVIADLAHFGGLDRLNHADPGLPRITAAASLLMEQPDDDRIDLIFCWDLLNYLTLDALSALMTTIESRARPGAIAHALISYSDRVMRDFPGRFVPTRDGQLVDCATFGTMVASPRYSSEALENNIGRFRIDRARLLRNGMQEYQLRLG